jgi:hypothetical protein
VSWTEVATVGLVLGGWLLVSQWLLPRLGVPT